MYTEEKIDFSQVESASSGSYLEPGAYRLKIDKDSVKVEAPKDKTPFLVVRFVSETGASVTEKFYLTTKALARLQYLHEAWFGKKLTASFKSMLEVGEYFQTYLTAKIITKPMIVGGTLNPTDGKFFSGLPYSDFVVPEGAPFEEGPFDKDSARYKAVVRIQKPNPAVAGTDAAMLPSTDGSGYAPVTGTPWD